MLKGFILLLFIFTGCGKSNIKEPFNFKQGTFLIEATENFDKTIIYRKDSLQIEYYQNRIDTLIIKWQSKFKYTLQMLKPRTSLDKKTIFVRITKVRSGGYDFTAQIGNSSFKQKASVKKIKE